MPASLAPLEDLLEHNAQWAEDMVKADPDFFKNSAQGQAPPTLWIGCADSRVPESVITAASPGDIFVHRNIANQLHLDDPNVLSVLQYAVDFVGVEHVIIVGHTECGGAAACLKATQSPSFTGDPPIVTIASLPADFPLNRWLEPLTKLTASLNLSGTPDALSVVVEENIKAQVDNLAKTETITSAWTKGTPKGQKVQIHGWVYELATGRLRDLNVSQGPPSVE